MSSDFLAVWTGLIISFINFLAGAAVISWGINKPDRKFYSWFFSGMLIRFALIFAVLFISIKVLRIHELLLATSLLTTYFAFMGLEIWIVHTSAQGKGTS